MSMGMSMSCGQHQVQRLETGLYQLQKLSLRQELKQLLSLLLKLIQGHRLTFQQVLEIQQAVAHLDKHDAYDIAQEIVRDCGMRNALEFGQNLRLVAKFAPEKFGNLLAFAEEVVEKVRHVKRMRGGRALEDPGPVLAMLMIMREPPLLGGCDGSPENLMRLLQSIPQIVDSHLWWVLGGGWAVELLTGKSTRHHHDIDTVVLNNIPHYLDTDEVHPTNYFGILTCNPEFFCSQCVRQVPWCYRGQTFQVLVLKPEFLFLSKFLRQPRNKDWQDVVDLVTVFAESWDLKLMQKLIRRNDCRFTHEKELLQILQQRIPSEILSRLSAFWSQFSTTPIGEQAVKVPA